MPGDGVSAQVRVVAGRDVRQLADYYLCGSEGEFDSSLELKNGDNLTKTNLYIDCNNSELPSHGLRTPNEGINQRNPKIWADVADKIWFGRT